MYLPSCSLLSLILCGCFADVMVFPSSDAEMTPKDPIFDEGETIVLNCTFTAHFNGTKDSSLLAFKHKGTKYGSEFVRLLTPETAQLRIPNATLDHHGHFACLLLPDDKQLGVGARQYVAVARRPLKPNVTQCLVINWESLICGWVPTRKEQNDHSERDPLYTAAIWHDDGFDSEICRKDELEDRFILAHDANVNFSSCKFQMGRSYTLQIEVANIISNPSKNATSENFSIHTSDIVWPNPPENLTYSFSGNGTAMSLRWNSPASKFLYDPLRLAYALSYRSKWDQTAKSVELSNEPSITLPCSPFTNYTITLKVRPLPLGYFSNETTLQFLTPSTVPCEQPDLNPRGFVLTSSLSSLERNVTLYWKSVPADKYCGPDIHYVASVRSSSGNWLNLNAAIFDTSVTIPIGPNETQIRILAKNKVGISREQQNIIHISSFPTPSSPVEEVVVEIDTRNSSYAMIRWGYQNFSRTVIFWCTLATELSGVVKCKNDIEWKELDKSKGEFEFSMLPDSDVHLIRFGISVDLLSTSSGIKWSTAVYALDKVAPPPEKFNAVIPYAADHGQVHISWREPRCSDTLCGHTDEYILFYCIVAESDRCTESSHSVSFSSTTFSHDLKGLSFGSKYQLWMLTRSKAGLSRSSVVATVEIPKPWKTTGAIVGIAIGALGTAMITVCGLYGIYRCCHKYKKKITRGVEIVLPRGVPVSKAMKTSSSSEAQILYNCYPSGYSRQGSDMSTLSRDSGRFSLTNPCATTNFMVLQQMSPLMSKSNGMLTASTITPLIGIQEDGATDDVFPAVQGPNGNNYVKTIVIEDPDDNSGYKVIRTVDSCRVNDNLANSGPHVPKVQLMKQPEVWVCSSPPSHTSLSDAGLFSRTPVLLSTTADADNSAYIRIAPGINLDDVDVLYKSPQTVPNSAASSSSSSSSTPLPGTDISYATVEMLNPKLSIPAHVGPDVGCAGNAMENGYTDLTFLTNSLLGNISQGDVTGQRLSRAEGKSSHQIDLEKEVPSEEAVGRDLSQRLSHPFTSESTLANSELNGNNNSEFKSLIYPIKNCLEVVTSGQNYAHFRNNFGGSHPVSSSPTQSICSPSAKELEKKNCNDAIPAPCDNGYILHTDLIGNM